MKMLLPPSFRPQTRANRLAPPLSQGSIEQEQSQWGEGALLYYFEATIIYYIYWSMNKTFWFFFWVEHQMANGRLISYYSIAYFKRTMNVEKLRFVLRGITLMFIIINYDNPISSAQYILFIQ